MNDELTVPGVKGISRFAVISEGKTLGAAWFGEAETCISVKVNDARGEVDTEERSMGGAAFTSWAFVADLVIFVSHQSDNPVYGFPKCVQCKKSLV